MDIKSATQQARAFPTCVGMLSLTGNNVLKELGGWSSLEMVLRYAHLSTEQLAEHAERLAKPKVIRTNSGTPKENAQPIRVGR